MSETTELKPNKTIKKNALGRGLGSLLGGEEGAFPKDLPKSSVLPAPLPVVPTTPDHARIWTIAIEKLSGNAKQPRQHFAKEPLEELALSIKQKGILQPIVARKISEGKYEIIAGERRWRAAQLAELKEVPVIIKDAEDQEALELALIENIQRQDLNPVEEAEAYAHLIDKYHLTQQQLAERTGKDRATIANMMRLLSLTPEARELVSRGELSTGQAKVLLSIADTKIQTQLAHKIAREKLTVRACEKLVAQTLKPVESKTANESERSLKGISENLQKIVGTKVAIDYTGGVGRLSLHFYSDEEFTHIIEKLKQAWQKS